MSTPILIRKLYILSHRPNLTLRPRLIECLGEGLLIQDEGFSRKLTRDSAAAEVPISPGQMIVTLEVNMVFQIQ